MKSTAASVLRVFGLALVGPALTAQTNCPTVLDINTSPSPFHGNPSGSRVGAGGTSAEGFLRCGNQWFFSASTPTTGRELWRTDGTSGGTVMVKDIQPGSAGSSPLYLVQYENGGSQ